jgi:hypothetical protein
VKEGESDEAEGEGCGAAILKNDEGSSWESGEGLHGPERAGTAREGGRKHCLFCFPVENRTEERERSALRVKGKRYGGQWTLWSVIEMLD